MTRRPGALSGRIAGDPQTQAVRVRRNRQRDALNTGSRAGAGITEDIQGRLAVNQLDRISPHDPDFNEKLVQQLIANGLMKR